MKTTNRVPIALLALMLCAGCSTTTEEGAIGVDRRQLLIVSSADMDKAAATQYQSVLKEQSTKGNVNQNPHQTERVRGVAARLIPQTAIFRKDALSWKWEVNVLTSSEVNAWCMPGGKIAVYTGIIEKLEMTDDELAAVMGHEMSHALREHSRERASQEAATSVGSTLAGIVADIFLPGSGSLGSAVAGTAGQLAYNLPYSRIQETEADRMGVELAARAGYDPRAAIALWQKMAKLSSGGAPPQILSTHPSHETRIKDLTEFAQKVLPLYDQARARS